MSSSDGNLVYSPYSLSLAFAMAYGGARNGTASQMADVLHYTLPGEQFHPAFNMLADELSRYPAQSSGDDFYLNIANSIWG